MTQLPMTVICQVLRIALRTVYYVTWARSDGRYHRTTDSMVVEQIRALTNSRATYGYRRVWAMVNRTFCTGLQPQAHSPGNAAARPDGRPARSSPPRPSISGQIQQPASNQRCVRTSS